MIMETTTITGSGMVDIYHAVLLILEVPKKKSPLAIKSAIGLIKLW